MERAAAASVRLDRCTKMEADRIDRKVRQVRARFLKRRRDAAERLGFEMANDPKALAALRATAIGCEWLLAEWDTLESRLGDPNGWSTGQPLLAGQLLGLPADAERPDPRLMAIFHDARRHQAGDAAASNRLRDLVHKAVAELEERCEELWEEVDGPALRAAIGRARFDGSPLAARMQRYESMHSADLHRCLRQLKARVGAPNEANGPAQLSTLPGLEPGGRGLVCEAQGTEAAAAGGSLASPQTPQDASSIHDPSLQDPSPPNLAPAAPNEANAKAQPSRKPKTSVPMEWRTRLAVDPAISRAWPVVKGTSITASQIGGLLTPPGAMSRDQIVAHFNGRITLEDIQAACDFLNDRGGIGHYED